MGSRRHNGEGSISEYATKAGKRLRIIWTENAVPGEPEHGTRKRSLGGFTTRKEAAVALRKQLQRVEDGLPEEIEAPLVTPSRIPTVKKYMEEWLATKRVAVTTIEKYKNMAELHVYPYVGSLPVTAVKPATLAKLYRDLEEHGRKLIGHIGEPLGPSTVIKVHQLINSMFNAAVDDELIGSNPARSSKANPPTLAEQRAARAEIIPWSPEQLNAVMAWCRAREPGIYTEVQITARTGLRRGELLGLRWQDIDLDAARIAVRRSRTLVKGRGRGQQEVIKPPKNNRTRVVDLDPTSVELLRSYWRQMAEVDESLTEYDHFVFLGKDFLPWIPDRLTVRFRDSVRKFRKTDEGRSVPRLSIHGLRHTHATILLMAGVHPKTVQERLGHSNIAITMDLYSHILPTTQQAAVQGFIDLVDGVPCEPAGPEEASRLSFTVKEVPRRSSQ